MHLTLCSLTFQRLNVICFVRTAQFAPSTTVTKTDQLMMYKAKVAVCSEILTKHSTQSERHVKFLNVQPAVT
jgi:hypothetical protein